MYETAEKNILGHERTDKHSRLREPHASALQWDNQHVHKEIRTQARTQNKEEHGNTWLWTVKYELDTQGLAKHID